MSGQLYYNKRGIRITDNHFMVHGGTYPLSNITDAGIRIEAPRRLGPLACLLSGMILLSTPFMNLWLGLLLGAPLGIPLLIIGLVWLNLQKPVHWLIIQTAMGRCDLYGSRDDKEVREIQGALVSAIAQGVLPSSSDQGFTRQPSVTLTREALRVRLLKAAQANQGLLSVTEGVLETGASFTEVEATLRDMVRAGYVSIDNHPETGIVLYRFLEFH
jgi:hypothetical protein